MASSPLKVGIVAENYFPTLGGIQEHIRHLRNFLTKAGVEVTILTGEPTVEKETPLPRDANDRVHRVGKARMYGTAGSFTQMTLGPGVWLRMRRELQEGGFDLLNIHGPCDFGLPLLALTMFKGPKVLTLHSCFPDAPFRHRVAPYYRWVFRQARSIVAVSAATRDSMQRYADFDATIVPNGVDVDYWRRGKKNARYLEPGTRNILYLGRLEHRNGPDLLVDAFPEILRAHPDVRLLIAGDGPARADCEARVAPEARGRVVFLGAVYDERPDLFASSELFLIPARAVGFSIMVLEAFAAGLPVVAVPSLGTDRAGDHWSNVIMSHEATPSSFAQTVIGALEHKQTDRIARGHTIASEYDWARVCPRVLDVFHGAVAS
jgi:phosphatidylinositol alpha-mannosyltransferase